MTEASALDCLVLATVLQSRTTFEYVILIAATNWIYRAVQVKRLSYAELGAQML